MAGFQLRVIWRDGEPVKQFRCKCGAWGDVDEDQLHGRVSIHHDDPSCGFHETIDLSELADAS